MGLFSTKSSSSSSNVTSQTTSSAIGDVSTTSIDLSNFFGGSVINSGSYHEGNRQSATSTPYVSQIPSQSSTTTQRNDSSATSSLGLGGGLGGAVDAMTGGSGLGSALGSAIGSAFGSGSKSSYDYIDSYQSGSSNLDSTYYDTSSSSSSFLPALLIGGAGIAAIWFLV